MVLQCWVKFQCRGVLPIWIMVGQGPTAPAVGVSGGYLEAFSRLSFLSFVSLSLEDGLKYCLVGPLNPKLVFDFA